VAIGLKRKIKAFKFEMGNSLELGFTVANTVEMMQMYCSYYSNTRGVTCPIGTVAPL
jgi:hypothetical protein